MTATQECDQLLGILQGADLDRLYNAGAADSSRVIGAYDSRVGTTIATGVSSWADYRGGGFGSPLVESTGANQPVINGSGEIQFDGVNDRLAYAAADTRIDLSDGAGLTFVLLAKFSGSSYDLVITDDPTTNSPARFFALNSTLANIRLGGKTNLYSSINRGSTMRLVVASIAARNGVGFGGDTMHRLYVASAPLVEALGQATYSNAGVVGNFISLGRFGTNFSSVKVRALWIIKGELSFTDMRWIEWYAINSHAATFDLTRSQIAFDGNSIMYGAKASNQLTTSPPPVAALLSSGRGTFTANNYATGVPSEGYGSQMVDQVLNYGQSSRPGAAFVAMRDRLAAYSDPRRVNGSVLVFWEGTNDISQAPNLTDLQAEANTATYVTWLANRGWRVIVCTIIDRIGFYFSGALNGQGTYAQNYNTWLRANWRSIGAFALIDVEAWTPDAGVTTPFKLNQSPKSYLNTTYYFTDGIHPVDGGNTQIALCVRSVIDANDDLLYPPY